MSTPVYQPGDYVIPDPYRVSAKLRGELFKVVKVSPGSIELAPHFGGRGVALHSDDLLPASQDAIDAAKAGKPVAVGIPIFEYLDGGVIVTLSHRSWTEPAGQLYVVLATRSDGDLKLTKLGGNDGRHWPAIPRGWATTVDPTRINLSPGE